MRLVSTAELLTLPLGTVFQEYRPHTLGEPQILLEVLPTDFVTQQVLPEADLMGYDGPLPVIRHPGWSCRDGMFDHESRRFLIWDIADCQRMASLLLNPLEELPEIEIEVRP